MKNFSWNKALPYIVAILLFIVLSFVYFSPVIEGKVVMGHDSQTYIGTSQEMRDYEEKTGEHQFWTNSLFGGMPTYQVSGYEGKGIMKYVHKALNVFPRPASFLFLYLLCGFLLLRSFRVNPWLSIAGSILIAFASYNFIIIAAGHNTKAIVMAYVMPLIGSVVLAYRGKRILGALLTAIFLGLAIYANHLQILYYTLLILILFFIVELIYDIKEKKVSNLLKTTGVLVVGALLGVAVNATSIMSNYEYSKYTMRGESNGLSMDTQSSQHGLNSDYITQWSYGVGETMTLLIPNFRGGASMGHLSENSHSARALGVRTAEQIEGVSFPLYWGTQPGTSGPVYVGAIVCFLFVLGLIIVNGRYKWWLLAVTVLSIMLAWGKNFMPFTEFFIDYVPLYNKFRAVSMTLVMAGIAMPLLGVLALKKIFDGSVDKDKLLLGLYIATGAVGGICLIFCIFPGLAGNFTAPIDDSLTRYGYPATIKSALQLDRKSLLSSDAFRSLAFILLTAGVLYFVIKDKLKTTYAIAILGVLFLLDMYPVAKRYLNDKNFIDKEATLQLWKATPADKAILQDKSLDYRVLNLSVDIFNDATTSYYHKSIGGYHGAKMRRYQELINIYLENEINNFKTGLGGVSTEEQLDEQLQKLTMLNMLNTKYIIINPNGQPLLNPFANGNAWLVDKVYLADDANAEMTMLGTLDTKQAIVVNKEFETAVQSVAHTDSTAFIDMTSYMPMHLKYHFKSNTEQIAVFSEIYYDKGWNAYINGEKVPYIRANYLLRAMPLKAGEYDVEFRFEPSVVKTGDIISIIASVLIVGLLVFIVWRRKEVLSDKE